MIRSVVFGSLVVGILASVAGCRVTVETKNRYTETNVLRTDTADWVGQPILIQIPAPGVIVNGGVNVETAQDPNVTKVSANARILATAFAEAESDARATLETVKTGFVITNTPTLITIRCAQGQTVGGSNGGESGCELTNIIVPQGTADKPLDLQIETTNGDLKVNALTGRLKRLAGNSENGDITVQVGPSQNSIGADISFVGLKGGDVTLDVPQDFAADNVFLVADADKRNASAFPDITALDGTVGRGAAGTGFKSIKLTSNEFAGSSGVVTLQ
ncbi:MAG: hypothetical protein KIT84_38060 [Labilithrix sp.]|nr:hypothetical protein [Labilithrix sp.]MCW5816864.1 hypothetical protein [Labilithrix sp.]